MRWSAYRYVPLILGALAFAACGDDDETGPGEDHTPEDARLFVNGIDRTADGLTLVQEQTLRVEIRFVDAEDVVIDGIDADHFSSLTFSPATLATTANVENENFQKDVTTTAAAPATGQVTVGYGHDEDADELQFGPFPVTVIGGGGGGPVVRLGN